MCIDTCIDMCVDTWIDMYRHVYGHVYGHVYRRVYRSVFAVEARNNRRKIDNLLQMMAEKADIGEFTSLTHQVTGLGDKIALLAPDDHVIVYTLMLCRIYHLQGFA